MAKTIIVPYNHSFILRSFSETPARASNLHAGADCIQITDAFDPFHVSRIEIHALNLTQTSAFLIARTTRLSDLHSLHAPSVASVWVFSVLSKTPAQCRLGRKRRSLLVSPQRRPQSNRPSKQPLSEPEMPRPNPTVSMMLSTILGQTSRRLRCSRALCDGNQLVGSGNLNSIHSYADERRWQECTNISA